MGDAGRGETHFPLVVKSRDWLPYTKHPNIRLLMNYYQLGVSLIKLTSRVISFKR